MATAVFAVVVEAKVGAADAVVVERSLKQLVAELARESGIKGVSVQEISVADYETLMGV